MIVAVLLTNKYPLSSQSSYECNNNSAFDTLHSAVVSLFTAAEAALLPVHVALPEVVMLRIVEFEKQLKPTQRLFLLTANEARRCDRHGAALLAGRWRYRSQAAWYSTIGFPPQHDSNIEAERPVKGQA